MSIVSFSPNTLNKLLSDATYSDEIIFFKGQTFDVTKAILATNSKYFTSLWYTECRENGENLLDVSNLPVSSETFSAFISSFYDVPMNVTPSNVYEIFYLAKHFQCDHLDSLLMEFLPSVLVQWEWVSQFLVNSNAQSNLKALKFVGPFVSKIDGLSTKSGITFNNSFIKPLLPFCKCSSSLQWFLKSLIVSIQSLTKEELESILNILDVESLCFKYWEDLLLKPLDCFEEFTDVLMKFHYKKLRPLFFETLSAENLKLRGELDQANQAIEEKDLVIEEREQQLVQKEEQIVLLKKELDEVKGEVQSKAIQNNSNLSFGTSRKHPNLSVLNGGRKVVNNDTNWHWQNILGESPLLPGKVYKWRISYSSLQSDSDSLMIGILPGNHFSEGGEVCCNTNAHCFYNAANNFVQSSRNGKWKAGEILEVTVDLVNNCITIKKENDSAFNCSRSITPLSGDNYYLVGCFLFQNSSIELL
ncbi:hypothetical protein P9112_010830 [Eukaryota sp. TZLM1-RC]